MLVISTTFAYGEIGEGSIVNIDEHTCKQINIFNSLDGAEIRLLQLEKSVANNICKGQLIISNLLDLGYETFDLELILAEMDLLSGEIQSVDVNSSEAVYFFVELKQDAIDLSKEFRETLNGQVDESTKTALQDAIKNDICGINQVLKTLIENKIRLYNKQQLNEIFRIIGITNTNDLQKYQNGTLSLLQVKQNLVLGIGELIDEEKFILLTQLKSDNIRLKIRSRVNIQNVTKDYGYRKCNRLQNRLNNSENIENETLRLHLQQRLRLRMNQTGDGHSGNGKGPGGGDNGSGNDQGPGGGGNGSGGGNGGNNNETGGGNGNHNGPGGGGPW
ncbi:hypothetical protein AYK24_00885 [Thermoplasmatales archaeon SG8-52-4]|nr:MAG: hypothetical protein AYK24_00885 [Thermoplasmatales archaeon SG8-52-4]